MADALRSGRSVRKDVRVRVPPSAPEIASRRVGTRTDGASVAVEVKASDRPAHRGSVGRSPRLRGELPHSGPLRNAAPMKSAPAFFLVAIAVAAAALVLALALGISWLVPLALISVVVLVGVALLLRRA